MLQEERRDSGTSWQQAPLARLLATLHDAEGRIAVRGFCDAVAPLQEWERKAWSGLPLNDARLLEITGADRLLDVRELAGPGSRTGRARAAVNVEGCERTVR